MDASYLALGLIIVIAVLTVRRMFRPRAARRVRDRGNPPYKILRHGDGGGAGGDNEGGGETD